MAKPTKQVQVSKAATPRLNSCRQPGYGTRHKSLLPCSTQPVIAYICQFEWLHSMIRLGDVDLVLLQLAGGSTLVLRDDVVCAGLQH